jgi:hypothetical protein
MATNYYETLVQEDLDTGTSTASKRNPGGGSITGTQISLSTFAVTQLEVTTTWNPSSIANGAEEAKEITVTGAALGDYAIASFSLDVSDLQLDANVTAANTVTAVLSNNTGAAVDLASGTLSVLVFKAR